MPWINASDIPREPLTRAEAREVQNFFAKKKHVAPRFYADANFPQPAVALIRAAGFDVLPAHEAGRASHSDNDHWEFARKKRRTLITCDRDFLDDRKFPLHLSPGVIVFDFGPGREEDMRASFQVITYIAEFSEFYDKWSKFAANRDGWTESLKFQDGSVARQRLRIHDGDLQLWMSDDPSDSC